MLAKTTGHRMATKMDFFATILDAPHQLVGSD